MTTRRGFLNTLAGIAAAAGKAAELKTPMTLSDRYVIRAAPRDGIRAKDRDRCAIDEEVQNCDARRDYRYSFDQRLRAETLVTRRALFAMLAAALLPKPPLTPSKWGGVRAYWLDEGRYPTLSRSDICFRDARLKKLTGVERDSGRYWRVKFDKPTNAFRFFIGDREL